MRKNGYAEAQFGDANHQRGRSVASNNTLFMIRVLEKYEQAHLAKQQIEKSEIRERAKKRSNMWRQKGLP